MPTIAHDRLQTIADRLLECSGASSEEAEIIARHVIGANLAGHDSHGIIQIPTYIDRVKRGHIIPGAPFDIVQETASVIVILRQTGCQQKFLAQRDNDLVQPRITANSSQVGDCLLDLQCITHSGR